MKKIRECSSAAVLLVLLVAGILLVMGAYRIFSYLCELPFTFTLVPVLLAAAAAALAVVGILLAKCAFARLKELNQNGEI